MKKMCSLIAVLLLSSMLPAYAKDNMKAFPPADQGKVRYVLQLPTQDDESAFKVELIVGKTVHVDEKNNYFFGGTIEEETIQGWGFPRYIVSKLGPMAARLWQSIQTRRKWPGLSRLAVIPISSDTTAVCPSWSMYPKALRCVIGSGLPERRQKQWRKVETGHLIEQEVPNKRMHADAAPRHRLCAAFGDTTIWK